MASFSCNTRAPSAIMKVVYEKHFVILYVAGSLVARQCVISC